ncbi:hypothetical protein N9372_02300 [Alphaproteobacteria bacterium]|nr:hypothetical protein [Alphaproteobacteria bacterium]
MKISPIYKIDLFSPMQIFFFLFVFFIIIPQVITYQVGLASLIDIWILLICLIGSLAFYFGNKHKHKLKFKSVRNTQIISYIAVIFLIIDVISGIQIFVSKEVHEYNTSFLVNDHSNIYKQLIYLVLLYIKYYTISILIARRQKLFWIAFLVEFFCYISSPVRLIALMPVVIFTIYGFYRSYIKITFLRSIVALCLLPFVLGALLLGRGISGNHSFFRTMLDIISDFDLERFSHILPIALESFMSYSYLRAVIVDNFVAIESGLLRNAFLFISRSIWHEKPESISRIIAERYNNQQYNEGGGSVATIFGDGFINLHIVGVFLICLIAGYSLKLVYNGINIKDNVREQSIRLMLYALSVHQFLFFFRGFMSETYWKFLILILVFKFLNALNLNFKRIG